MIVRSARYADYNELVYLGVCDWGFERRVVRLDG